MDYFQLSSELAALDVRPATTADILDASSGSITDVDGLDAKATFGHFALEPVLHPWLISDFASVCGLPLSTLDRLMFGGIGVVAASPRGGAHQPGAFVRMSDVGALVERFGPALDVRTGPSGVRTLARLWPLASCRERLARLAAGEKLDPFFRPMSDDDRNGVVAAGSNVVAKLDAHALAPADMFLEFVPIAPPSFRPSDAWRGEHRRNARAAIEAVLRRERRRARMPVMLLLEQQTIVQEAVFELFTAGTICMAGSAGLIDDDLASDFIEDKLSDTAEEEGALVSKEQVLRSIFDEKPRVRSPGDLFIWARRAQASFQLLSHFFRASRAEPRDRWVALFRSAGLAVNPSSSDR